MAKPRYEYCEVAEIRGRIEEQLPKLPAQKANDETAAEFWSRVERAGLLHQALALYDELAAWRRDTRRETKKQFDERIEREGRRAEVERVRAELWASGQTQRQIQVELVRRFHPRDGTKRKAWETPDPWDHGRLFKTKKDQQLVLEEIERDEDEGVTEAENRLHWAERRRDERQALADARRHAAQALKPGQLRPASLCTEVARDGKVRTSDKGWRKARRRVRGAQKPSVRRKSDGDKLPSASKATIGASIPPSIQESNLTATQAAVRSVTAPKVITAQIPPEPVQNPKRLTPLLCPPCRRLGHANCPERMLATDSSLAIDDGMIRIVRQPTERDRWPWHRCQRCDNSFKAPQFPAQRLCPDCVLTEALQLGRK